MKIVNGKKFYAADYGAAKRIDSNGWDRYDWMVSLLTKSF